MALVYRKNFVGIRFLLIWLALSACLLCAHKAYASVQVSMQNGDRVSGSLTEVTAHKVKLAVPGMGSVFIDRSYISAVEPSNALEAFFKQPDSKEMKWSGEVAGGFTRSRGNTSSTGLNGTAQFRLKGDHQEHSLKGFGYYNAQDRKMTTRKYGGSGRMAYSFGPEWKWYHFYKAEADHDFFGSIDFRVTPTAGVGYWFSDTLPFKWMAELGAGVTYTEFVGTDDTTTEMELVPRFFAEFQVYRGITLSQEVIYYPSVEAFSDYRLKAVTTLDSSISDRLSLRLSVVDDYNSNPRGTAKENDLRILSSLAYKI